MGFWSGYWVCFLGGCGACPAQGSAGAGDADAPALVRGVAEPVGEAGLELGEPVQALGGGVRAHRRVRLILMMERSCRGSGWFTPFIPGPARTSSSCSGGGPGVWT